MGKRHVVVVGMALVTITGSLVKVLGAGASAPLPTLLSVSSGKLSRAEISLAAPSASSSVAITTQAAKATATSAFPGTAVRETILATVVDNSRAPAFECLCYAVSLMPTNLPSQGPPGAPKLGHPNFTVAVIDADTGKLEYGVGG